MTATTSDPRRRIIRLATFLGGIYFFLYFVFPESLIERWGIKDAHEPISNGFIVVGTMALGLGIINILSAHGSNVIFKRRGWQYSLALLCGLGLMIAATTAQWLKASAVTEKVKRVQLIGDFSQRIIEDDEFLSGKKEGSIKSVAPNGTFPTLAERVRALGVYSDTSIEEMKSYLASRGDPDRLSAATRELKREMEQAMQELQESRRGLEPIVGGSLSAEELNRLQRFAQRAGKLSSAYALMLRQGSSQGLSQRIYDLLYNGLFNQLGSAMFALLGVYIAAAAYRAFRIKTLESALMMSAALIVMLGQISVGTYIYQDLPAIRQWLLEVPNSAAFRAIRLGAAVAGLMLAIRMWLSIESTSFSSKRR